MPILDKIKLGRAYDPLSYLAVEAESLTFPFLSRVAYVRSHLPISSDPDTEMYINLISLGVLGLSIAGAVAYSVYNRRITGPSAVAIDAITALEKTATSTVKVADGTVSIIRTTAKDSARIVGRTIESLVDEQ